MGSVNILIKKIKRVIIPLVSTALTLNFFQYVIASRFSNTSISIYSYFGDGKWVSHLWFLNNLVIYFLFTLFLYKISLYLRIQKFISTSYLDKINIIYLSLLFPFTFIFVKSLNKFGIPIYNNLFNIFSMYSVLIYYPYFVLGVLFSSSNYINKNFSKKYIVCLYVMLIPLYFLNNYLENNSYNVILTTYL